MSISPTFYEQLFCKKVFSAVFICLPYRFVIILQKEIGAKAAQKMLVKLTKGDENKKILPCITIHSLSAFKTRGFFYTPEAIKNNSFSAEEVFDLQFLNTLRNESQYWMKEFSSIYYGTCFTICYLKKVSARKNVALQLQRNLTFVLNFHVRGEEIWLTTKTHLIEKSFTVNSNSNEIIETKFSIREMENKVLGDDQKSCKTYSSEASIKNEKIGFTQCAVQVLMSYFQSSLKCSIEVFIDFTDQILSIPKCNNFSSAAETFDKMIDITLSFTQNTGQLGCPLPCNELEYSISHKSFHVNSCIDPFKRMKFDFEKNYLLSFAYEYLEVEEKVESYVYDLGAFLAIVGGNLGLALGFSCLSMLLSLLKILYRWKPRKMM